MTDSTKLAGLIGPSLIAIAASEAMNFHIFAINDPRITYLDGTLLFIAGVAILRAHSRWVRSWPVLITLTGWIGIIGGLYRMFAPTAPQASPGVGTNVMFAVIGVAGVVLTYQAYATPKRRASRS